MSIIFEELKKEKLLANIRGIPSETIYDTCSALIQGGVRFLEITLNTEGALDAIYQVKKEFDGVFVAAGTIMTKQMADEAIAAGSDYLISPHVNPEIAPYAEKLPVWMGAMTPSEIVTAYELGSEVVKIYPAGSLGVGYFNTIREPLPQIPMLTAGGITLETAKDFLAAGACAVSIAKGLVDKTDIQEKRYDEIKKRAQNHLYALHA